MMNRLAEEKSPYLLQHAHNPVDWFPWGEEAFRAARERAVPIFLSIGYSTCHWCHVMERESFENEEVAHFLNGHFISIKVDREERPDIDEIYMAAVQAVSGSGGWPMSIFLTPELRPFYAGTYFPPRPAYGRPSFQQLLERINELWHNERGSLIESSKALTEALLDRASALATLDTSDAARRCFQYFEQSFDREYGGFGSAPKFPRPVQFDFLLEYWLQASNSQALDMVTTSLSRMASGGIYDHVGGGFHRYSVDRFWRVSHFEKMLYDQAQITNSLLDAWQITHKDRFANAARGVCEYVLRDLSSPEGGYFSAEDADSEGEEGKYYVWTRPDVFAILGDRAEVVARRFGITESGNCEHGKNVLHTSESIEGISGALGKTEDQVRAELGSALNTLYSFREGRVRPHLDDKVLTSWNGLTIGAMARAGAVLGDMRYLNSATAAANFVWVNLRVDNQLRHRWRDGECRIAAMLDDYAFYISGLLALHQATLEPEWLERAIELQRDQDSILWDNEAGGYFTTRESPDVIVRRKNGYDGAEPSGNSISCLNLLALSILTEESSYRDKAEHIVRAFGEVLSKHPYAMPELMAAAMRLDRPPRQLILSGEPEAVRELHRGLQSMFDPDLYVIDASSAKGIFASGLKSEDHSVTAYLCRDLVCERPVHDITALRNLIGTHFPTRMNA